MDKQKRGVLYGLAIGDGGIYLLKDQSPNTARLIIGHSPKQREYLEFKQRLLQSTIGGKEPKIYEYTSFNKTANRSYTNLQLYKNDKYFRQMHRVLYPYGEKRYTEKLLGYLTDHSLALWYMDDGSGTKCKNKEGKVTGCMTRLATYCSKEEAEIMRRWFIDKYGITPAFDLDKRNDKISLRFNTKDSKKFVSIISKYIVPSMKYKIEHISDYVPRVQDTLRGEDIV